MLALEVIVAAAVLIGIAFIAARPDVEGIDEPDTDHMDIGLPEDRLMRSDSQTMRLRRLARKSWHSTASAGTLST